MIGLIDKMVSTNDWSILDVIKFAKTGEWIMPNFQRDFVWSRDQVHDLLESIRTGIPIGTMTTWKFKLGAEKGLFEPFFSKEQASTGIFTVSIEGDKNSLDFSYNKKDKLDVKGELKRYAIVDGRQRITSLMIAFDGSTFHHHKNRHSGCWALDLDKEVEGEPSPFKWISRKVMEKERLSMADWINNHEFPLWLIKHDKIFRKNLKNKACHSGNKLPKNIDEMVDAVETFCDIATEHRIGDYQLDDRINLDTVCEIFERVNTAGTKVGVYDIIAAKLIGKTDHLTTKGSFELKKRIKQISNDSLAKSFPMLKFWYDENDGKGGKTACQLVTSLYMGDDENYTGDSRKVSSYKSSDLIQTPWRFYLKQFDKSKKLNNLKGLPNLSKMEQYLEDFANITVGGVKRSKVPYPILAGIYVSMRYEYEKSAKYKSIRDDKTKSVLCSSALNDAFRVHYWRSVTSNHYNHGFLTGAVADRDALLKFVVNSDNISTLAKSKDDWWKDLDVYLSKKIGYSSLDKPQIKDYISGKQKCDGAIKKALQQVILSRKPSDLKDLKQIKTWEGEKYEMHHIFPKGLLDKLAIKSEKGVVEDLKISLSILVPLRPEHNNEWKSNSPEKMLLRWHPKKKNLWKNWETEMTKLRINEKMFDILINDKKGLVLRAKAFCKLRNKMLFEDLESLLDCSNLDAGFWS